MPTLAATLRDRLNTDELHQLKWLLGQYLALISIWALFGLEMGSEPLLIVFLLIIFVSLLFPKLPGAIPPIAWKASTPLLIAFIVVDFALHGVEFLKPMVRMIMLLTFLRAMQYRKSREDLQLVLLCLFTLVVKGVLTVSILFAFQMIIFTPAAMALLFLVNLLQTSRDRQLVTSDWAKFRWLRFCSRLSNGLDFRLLGFAGILFVCLVTISTLIFLLMPRFNMDRALPFLQMEGQGKVGFSDRIRFGDVNSLSFDNGEALRVTVPSFNSVPAKPYWRMVVLDQYEFGAFEASTSLLEKSMRMLEARSYPDLGYSSSNSERDWVFFLEGDISRYLPLVGTYDRITFAQKSKFMPNPETSVIMLDRIPSNVFGYQISGLIPTDQLPATRSDRNVLEQADGPIITPDWDDEQLEYPLTTLAIPRFPDDVEYLKSIVAEISDGETLPPEEFAQRVQQWLKENYVYDTQHVPFDDGAIDPLINWMKNSDRGWCEYFAGAFTLICRTAGIPTRVIAGFAGAYWNQYEDYLIVYNSNAHAWAEIYINGTWVRYDPTPPVTTSMMQGAAIATTIGSVSGWSAWLDSLRMVWYRRVVNFDQGDQMQMATGIRDFSLSTYEDFKSRLINLWTRFKEWLLYGWDTQKAITLMLWFLGLSFGLVGVFYLWRYLRENAGRGGPWAHFIGGDPIRRQAGKLLNKYRPLWKIKREQTESQNLARWQQTLNGLQQIRFGPTEDRPDHRAIFKEAKRLIRSGPEKV